MGDQVPMPDPEFDANAFAQTLPGITGPLGFFDPAGFCSNDNGAEGTATEGKVRFYREVEVKHCRVAMLAAFGYPLAEVFHPLFGGGINGPSFSAFQQTPFRPSGRPWSSRSRSSRCSPSCPPLRTRTSRGGPLRPRTRRATWASTRSA